MSKSRNYDPLVYVFDKSERKTWGAYFWDGIGDALPAWKGLEYEWIASSCFGDQVILTGNSPLHDGPAIYLSGPDVAGPRSSNPNWTDNILYLGSSIEEWLARLERFGDEHSVAPGSIDERLRERSTEYRAIYRQLNPGLPW